MFSQLPPSHTLSASSFPSPVMPHIIVLVGLMGAGKTTLGRHLAQLYNIPFIDADTEIERAAGCSIAEIFERHGEAHFREGEHRVVKRLLQGGPCILATGGGAWMDGRTRRAVKETPRACSVWLRVPIDILFQRVRHGSTERPLLKGNDPATTLKRLATQRDPFYAMADIIIDCGENSVEHGLSTIQNALRNTLKAESYPMTNNATVSVSLAHHHYNVHIGRALLPHTARILAPCLKTTHAVIITDENVEALHLEPLKKALVKENIRVDVFSVPTGEQSKSLSRYNLLIEDILNTGIERSTTIIALGGGVVGDLAGFVAATALRGLPFVQIPTTLLAQVDSSVGGKTGINARAGKNLIGAFWQPHLVIADTEVLKTLPRRQLVAGYAEIVKSGLIADPELFAWCEDNGAKVLEGNSTALTEAVRRACHFKTQIITQDEREQAREGGRALLNLGHTFAHALETEYHYDGSLLHGEAVSIGIHLALALSVTLGLAPAEDLQRLDQHLLRLDMPARLDTLPTRLSAETLIRHMMHDKKLRNGRLNFVLLHRIGHAFTTCDVPMEKVRLLLLDEGCLP